MRTQHNTKLLNKQLSNLGFDEDEQRKSNASSISEKITYFDNHALDLELIVYKNIDGNYYFKVFDKRITEELIYRDSELIRLTIFIKGFYAGREYQSYK
jgi:hypothetical protein